MLPAQRAVTSLRSARRILMDQLFGEDELAVARHARGRLLTAAQIDMDGRLLGGIVDGIGTGPTPELVHEPVPVAILRRRPTGERIIAVAAVQMSRRLRRRSSLPAPP